MLPGQREATAAQESERAGGLIFTAAEVEALRELGREANVSSTELAAESFA